MSSKKVAVITGSGDGLGKGIAERLAQDGFAIVLSDINPDTLATTEAEFKARGAAVSAFLGDVGKREDQFALVKHAADTFGRVDVFINNAGIEDVMALEDVREADIDRVFNINVKGVIFGTQAAAEQMKKQGGGRVCKIIKHKITVNAYCPGVAATKMWDRIDAEMAKYMDTKPGEAFEKFSAGILMGRPQVPQDVAALVHYLASEDSDYMTGQSLLIDGGMVFR